MSLHQADQILLFSLDAVTRSELLREAKLPQLPFPPDRLTLLNRPNILANAGAATWNDSPDTALAAELKDWADEYRPQYIPFLFRYIDISNTSVMIMLAEGDLAQTVSTSTVEVTFRLRRDAIPRSLPFVAYLATTCTAATAMLVVIDSAARPFGIHVADLPSTMDFASGNLCIRSSVFGCALYALSSSVGGCIRRNAEDDDLLAQGLEGLFYGAECAASWERLSHAASNFDSRNLIRATTPGGRPDASGLQNLPFAPLLPPASPPESLACDYSALEALATRLRLSLPFLMHILNRAAPAFRRVSWLVRETAIVE